jgi:dihydroneopterin aldolase
MADKIFIRELKVPCLIGIFDWERKKKQIVSIDLEFPAPISKAARTDKIRDAVDYKKIAKRTIQFVAQSRFYLIEALIESLAALLLKEFSLKEITLQIEKPGAIRGARTVGIRITRKHR